MVYGNNGILLWKTWCPLGGNVDFVSNPFKMLNLGVFPKQKFSIRLVQF